MLKRLFGRKPTDENAFEVVAMPLADALVAALYARRQIHPWPKTWSRNAHESLPILASV